MRSNRVKYLLVAMLAVFALGAVAAGSAQAEPTYHHKGAALTESFAVRYTSMWSRLWGWELGVVIVCEKDNGTGTITTKGEDTVEGLVYTGCKVYEATKNATTKQYEQGDPLTKCGVKGGGGVEGEIKLPALKSKLVYVPKSTEKELLVRLEPKEGTTFVTLEVTGTECLAKGTFKVTGSVLGWVPRPEQTAGPLEEAVANSVLFEVKNNNEAKETEGGPPRQYYKSYELGGVTTEDVLKLEGKPTAYESTEQVELTEVSSKTGLFSAHV